MTGLLRAATAPGDARASGLTVAEAMVRRPKTCDRSTTVAQARALFADDHVHALLVVRARTLLAVVVRPDLDHAHPLALAADHGALHARIVGPSADLPRTHQTMIDTGIRRLAVVTADHVLLGLLCLKKHRGGFCSDADVAARAAERGG